MGTQDDLDQDDSSFLGCYTSSFTDVFSYRSRKNHVPFFWSSNGGHFLASNSGNREPRQKFEKGKKAKIVLYKLK
jgi:hypothetical protein